MSTRCHGATARGNRCELDAGHVGDCERNAHDPSASTWREAERAKAAKAVNTRAYYRDWRAARAAVASLDMAHFKAKKAGLSAQTLSLLTTALSSAQQDADYAYRLWESAKAAKAAGGAQ